MGPCNRGDRPWRRRALSPLSPQPRRHRRADYLIAATALLLEADLITTNLRYFPMIEDLRAPY
jgi:predicted nucleic acid-binding protein